jgi:protein-disulfide isomerase
VGAEDHILGSPDAPVKIIEYADYDCEYCRDFSDTVRKVIATSGAKGEVAWVYRQFPLVELHPNARAHARAAECVAKVAGNEAFWRMSDLLFANQPADPSRYGAFAKEAGVEDETAYAHCYAEAASTVDARIDADQQNALAIGASGTPYSIVLVRGGRPLVLDGAYSYDALKEIVDAALADLP